MNTSEELGEAIQKEHAETESCVQDQVTDETEHKNEVPITKRLGIPGPWTTFEKLEEDEKSKPPRRSTGGEVKGNLSDRWQASTFQDAMKGSSQKPPWVIEDLLLADSATLVSAQPHAMKSLSLLSACLEAVTTKKVWGHFAADKVSSVLFLETEDPPWMVESRIRGLAKGFGISEKDRVEGFHYACVGPFDFLNENQNIQKLLDKHTPDFLVLSTLQNLLVGRDWNRQQDMQPIMSDMIMLARQCPLFLVTHSPWDKRQKRAAGSVTQAANFLTAMHYEKKVAVKTGETFVHVSVDSKAGALETNFSLKLEIDGSPRDPGSVRGLFYAGKGWPKGTGKQAILAELEADPEASPKEIAERTELTERYVQRIIREEADRRGGKPA